MFCVITRTLVCCFLPGHVAAATCVTAKWPALGSYLRSVVLPGSATTCAGIQNLLYHARGSLRKAWRRGRARVRVGLGLGLGLGLKLGLGSGLRLGLRLG